MKKCILINSPTHVQRAKKILFEKNIKCYTEKFRRGSDLGCSWCVVTDENSLSLAITLLRQRRIPIYGIKNHD